MRRKTFFVAALIAMLGASTRLPASVLTDSSLSLQAHAVANGTPNSDSHSDSQIQAINPLSVSASAVAVNGNDTAQVYGSGSATWINAAQGKVSLQLGWSFSAPDGGSASFGIPQWTHDFTSDASGLYQVSYSTSLSGNNPFGSAPFTILFNGTPLGTANLNSSGSFSQAITAGMPYQVEIESSPNIGGNVGTSTMLESGTFNWQFTAKDPNLPPAPEPASLALLSLGALGLVAMRLRPASRKRD